MIGQSLHRIALEMIPRTCLVPPPQIIFDVATALSEAAQRHAVGDFVRAHRLLQKANHPEIRRHTENLWGAGGKQRHGFVNINEALPYLRVDQRPLPRMPSPSTRQQVLLRDGFHCRFCGMPVVPAGTRKAIHRSYPDAVPWGKINTEQHAALQCMWLQFDHVLPNSRGGTSDADNIVITCAPCNFARMEFMLEEACLVDPRLRFDTETWSGYAGWNGLSAFLSC
jgi:hypothetical protein